MANALKLLMPNEIEGFWPLMLPWVERGIEKNQGEYDSVDVKKYLKSGEWFGWLVYNEKGVVAAVVVSNETQFPRYRAHQLILVSGRNMKTWLPLMKEVEAFAKDNGCAKLTSYGRIGWGRVLCKYGFTDTYNVMEKAL